MQGRKTFSKNGFSLSELLIALAILGVISAFAIPHLFSSSNKQVTASKQTSAEEMLQNGMQMANGKTGLLPMAMGPGKALKDYMKADQYDVPAYSTVPQACKDLPKENNMDVVQAGDYHAKLANGTHVYGLSPTWNTSIVDEQNQPVDPVCILTN